MSNGGYKGNTPARETSPEQYPGVWELTEQFQAQADGNWPFQDTDCAPKSLRFNASDNSYLSKIPASSGNSRTWTWSGWVKCTDLVAQTFILAAGSSPYFQFYFSSTVLYIELSGAYLATAQVFRDPAAFYHLVLAFDTSQLTAANRVKLYVNGSEVTTWTTDQRSSIARNTDTAINSATQHNIGKQSVAAAYSNMMLADVHFIDGQALTPDAFTFIDGQGVLQPKRFTGDYSSGPVYSNFLTGGIDSSYPAPKGFDGVTSGVGVRTSANGTMVWQPSSPIGFNSSFKIYCALDGNSYGNSFTVTHAGGTTDFTSSVVTTTTNTAVDLAQISGVTSPITKITVVSGGSNPRFSAIEVDGTFLTDALVGRNSFHLDFSDKAKDQSGLGNDWTPNNLSALPGVDYGGLVQGTLDTQYGNASADTAFNGTISTAYSQGIRPTGGNYLSMNFGSLFSSASTVQIYGYASLQGNVYAGANENLKINGTAIGVSEWTTGPGHGNKIFNLSSGLQTLEWGYSSGSLSTGYLYLQAIKVDGVLLVNGSPSDQDCLLDSPVNGNQTDAAGLGGIVQGNYCCLNPLDTLATALSDGNLQATGNTSTAGVTGTIGISSGKYYWEVTAGSDKDIVGVWPTSYKISGFPGSTADSYGYFGNGLILNNGAGTAYGGSFGSGDIIGVALDLDNGTLTFYKNNVSQGTAVSGLVGYFRPAIRAGRGDTASTLTVNFGQRAFKHPLAGYKSLCTSNLPEPSIPIPSQYFDTKLWTGDGASTRTIPTVFQPDFVWLKNRGAAGRSHYLYDAVRGFGANKELVSNSTVEEGSNNHLTQNHGYLSGTTATGFTLAAGATNSTYTNDSGNSYVGWAWDGGDATTSIAAGSLNSSAYNQSQAWSSLVSTTDGLRSGGGAFAYGALSTIFDGNLSNGVGTNAGNLTLSFSTGISTTNSTVEIYIYHVYYATITTTTGTFTTNTGPSNVTSWISVSGVSGTITSIVVSGSGSVGTCGAIKIDGKILVDSGVAPATNVPSIPSTVRSSPESGFSITKWTGNGTNGATVAHNLSGAENGMIIVKNASSTVGPWWAVYHKSLTTGKVLGLNSTQPEFDETYLTRGIIENVTSSTFTCTSGSAGSETANGSGDEHIAYAWAPIEGYSSFGSYENPSSSQGAFVFLGFKPELLIIKCALQGTSNSGLGDWIIKDSTRSPFNNPSDGNTLVANVNNAEDSYYNPGQAAIDFLSNGFKIRHPNSSPAGDPGRIYVYAAWAESPFKTARAQ
jgi:hypothetical protein